MTWSDAGISFVTLFAAALLAFYLDSVREHRATRRWVREYLGFWRGTLETFAEDRATNLALFDTVDAAVGELLEAETEVPESVWELVDALNFNTAVSLTPPLLGEGGSVMPADLFQSMYVVDSVVQGVRANAQSTMQLFESCVRPLVLRRPWPLSDEETRTVALYRRELAGLRAWVVTLYDKLDELLASLTAAKV